MLRVDRMRFNRNFFGSQAGSPEAHGRTGSVISVLPVRLGVPPVSLRFYTVAYCTPN